MERRYQGKTDVPLNPKGIRQAKVIARLLQKEGPSYLYTSKLRRAQDTARVIGRKLHLQPVSDARLNELDFGKWEGLTFGDLSGKNRKTFQRWREGKLTKPPGGESLHSLARRVGQFFKEITQRHQEQTVTIISHGGPIKMFLLKALFVVGAYGRRPLPSIWSFRIEPASVSLIEGTPELFQIAWMNRTDHLL